MSVINRMLQELDRRHAAAPPDALSQQVQAVRVRRRRRDLFWLILGLEVAVALGWLAWTRYQLRPHSVVTPLALQSLGKPRPAQPKPIKRAQPAPPAPVAQEPPPPPPSPAAAIELTQASPPADVPAPPRKAAEPRPRKVVPRPAVPARAAAPRVEKRAHTDTPAQIAEAQLRGALHLLDEGRISEAEQGFKSALASDPSNQAARQALISLLVDQRRLDEARGLLQQGLALDPAQVQFATVLARIYVERDDYAKALEVLRGCKGDVSHDAAYNSLLGAVLQHLSRPGEAADAYRAALRAAPQAGTAWIGLGLALAAQNHRPEAAEAFRRAVATGSLNRELTRYAEAQLRRLQSR